MRRVEAGARIGADGDRRHREFTHRGDGRFDGQDRGERIEGTIPPEPADSIWISPSFGRPETGGG
ncbi:hypothetical protein ASD39_10460 [Sphingomonas sp. Root50]|nr:hypothetical protein ASD17_10400 [Sphingomonas sp. Root1294]KQY67516.1 hypothetical protein ASD39_10460 [Sphingomonas sp. Root50]KRB90893.1 hypothetical protein ASE22_11465 [Sphingomonas sp. Root720]